MTLPKLSAISIWVSLGLLGFLLDLLCICLGGLRKVDWFTRWWNRNVLYPYMNIRYGLDDANVAISRLESGHNIHKGDTGFSEIVWLFGKLGGGSLTVKIDDVRPSEFVPVQPEDKLHDTETLSSVPFVYAFDTNGNASPVDSVKRLRGIHTTTTRQLRKEGRRYTVYSIILLSIVGLLLQAVSLVMTNYVS